MNECCWHSTLLYNINLKVKQDTLREPRSIDRKDRVECAAKMEQIRRLAFDDQFLFFEVSNPVKQGDCISPRLPLELLSMKPIRIIIVMGMDVNNFRILSNNGSKAGRSISK
jgi:hypothetical protein